MAARPSGVYTGYASYQQPPTTGGYPTTYQQPPTTGGYPTTYQQPPTTGGYPTTYQQPPTTGGYPTTYQQPPTTGGYSTPYQSGYTTPTATGGYPTPYQSGYTTPTATGGYSTPYQSGYTTPTATGGYPTTYQQPTATGSYPTPYQQPPATGGYPAPSSYNNTGPSMVVVLPTVTATPPPIPTTAVIKRPGPIIPTRIVLPPPETAAEAKEYVAWYNKLRAFIDVFLGSVVPNAEERKKYVGEEQMRYWVAAFTHVSIDSKHNYEILEHIGDGVLQSIFAIYLVARFPNSTEKAYTELFRANMSKTKQPYLSRKYKFHEHVRIVAFSDGGDERKIPVPETVLGDLFEAFYGALYLVAESIIKGIGDAVSSNMLRVMFNPEEIDLREAKGNVISIVKQTFTRFGKAFRVNESIVEDDEGHFKITLYNTLGLSYLNSVIPVELGVEFNPALPIGTRAGMDVETTIKAGFPVAIGEGDNEEEAKTAAYRKAQEALNLAGITQEALTRMKREHDFKGEFS